MRLSGAWSPLPWCQPQQGRPRKQRAVGADSGGRGARHDPGPAGDIDYALSWLERSDLYEIISPRTEDAWNQVPLVVLRRVSDELPLRMCAHATLPPFHL